MEVLKIHATGIVKHGDIDYEAVVKLAEVFLSLLFSFYPFFSTEASLCYKGSCIDNAFCDMHRDSMEQTLEMFAQKLACQPSEQSVIM